MRFFTQTAQCSVNKAVASISLEQLPETILKYTDWDYSYQQRDNGCFLKPTFRNMPYRNSFVPEISIVVSLQEAYPTMQISGRPVKVVRGFMAVWCSLLLMMEALSIILFIWSRHGSLFPIIMPLVMLVFGCLLCEFATKATFNSVVKAIKKEYS